MTETKYFSTTKQKCAIHIFRPKSTDTPRGIAVVYHGFGAHAKYPTVRYVSLLLVKHGYVVYSPDMPGHGKSEGTRGLLPSTVVELIDFGVTAAKFATNDCSKQYNNKTSLPVFFVGSSMGGAIALNVSKRLHRRKKSSSSSSLSMDLRGVVMLAPMLALDVSPFERSLLTALSWILPGFLPLIPSSATNSEHQYRDPAKRKEADSDPLTYNGRLRLASAKTCVELALHTRQTLQNVTCPFLCMIGTEDVVVDNVGARELMTKSEKIASKDKCLKEYAALHGLICEPQPLLGEMEGDIVQWLSQRCS